MIDLQTPRLRLRSITEADASAHLALYGDPEVTRQLGGGPFLGEQVAVRSRRAIARFVRHWAENGFGVFAVEDLATEAARAALAYGFDEVRLPRIIAVTRPEHTRSRGVLEKLGLRYERDVDVFGIRAVLYAATRDAFHAAAH